jgi:hypothetical protein
VVLIAAGILVALALVGLGAAKLRGAAQTGSRQTPTAGRGTVTAHGTATAVPTIPNFSVPTGHLSVDYQGALTSSQTCIGTDALPELTINLSNGGNVAVDWWVQIKQMLPDGKTLWAGPSPPYNTLPPGQTAQLNVQPDPGLCGELIGHSSKVQYTATVNYGGGSGMFTITDTITPPPPGTSTPTPTVPPTPYS